MRLFPHLPEMSCEMKTQPSLGCTLQHKAILRTAMYFLKVAENLSREGRKYLVEELK